MDNCLTCKDYRECMQDCTWFHYGQIRFCPYQIIWIISHKQELEAGRWPQDPHGSADDNPRSGNTATEASFVKPDIVIAELEERLRAAGSQAELLICQVEDGRSFSNLSSGAREVLMYAKGFRRKRQNFNAWKRQRRYRAKEAV